MKNFASLVSIKNLLFFIQLILVTINIHAGESPVIHGLVHDRINDEPIVFATVSLHNAVDTMLLTGTVTDEKGKFEITPPYRGEFFLRMSSIGYSSEYIKINFPEEKDLDIGMICLQQEDYLLEEASVTGERLKAKSEESKSIYYMNSSIYSVSHSSTDMLTMIPGIQLDLMQNLTMEGKHNIKIFVDGKERDLDFLKQLDAQLVDRIEINTNPGPMYEADTEGVINLVLKERNQGISGHIHAEIPTSASEVYLFPSYNLSYGKGELNFYTSYNGELSYFNILNSEYIEMSINHDKFNANTLQTVRQKNWSHRFHSGIDYEINRKNNLTLYTSVHPYSWEQDGTVNMTILKSFSDNSATGKKEDTDRNLWTHYSLFFTHIFDDPETKISADIEYSRFRAENTILYSYGNSDNFAITEQINSQKPVRDLISIKSDFISRKREWMEYSSGIKFTLGKLEDLIDKNFFYSDQNLSFYNAISGKFPAWGFKVGLRLEMTSLYAGSFSKKNYLNLLPNFSLQYKLGAKQNLNLAFNKTVINPGIYQLNPSENFENPFRIHRGNPDLKPSANNNLNLKYSIQTGKNYLSVTMFYEETKDAIAEWFYVKDSGIVEAVYGNPGGFREAGIKISGSWKLDKFISINHYFNLFHNQFFVNNEEEENRISDNSEIAFESSLSAIISLRHNFSLSFQYQYNSPVRVFQLTTWNDPLYFCTLEKNFGERMKIGLTTAIPFQESINYHEEKLQTENLKLRWKGSIQKSFFPVWIKIHYRFQSGKKLNITEHRREIIEDTRKKGF